MRKLIASTFVSLDGILQAPGGPDEDPAGFPHGGWVFPYFDEETDVSGAGFDGKDRELVLGRKTYEIFEAYWPYQAKDDPIATILNAARKHVATRTLKAPLEWHNSTVLGGDVVAAVRALKATPGQDLQIIGSGNLIQTMQGAGLIDEWNIWTFPVVLGRGKRLFEAGARPGALRLVESKVSKLGVVMSRYVPDGEVKAGTFEQTAPSKKELARRAKMARERRSA